VHTVADVDVASPVALLRWPRDAVERDELARQGVPRMLLVGAGEAVPPPYDELEDWIRTPADERDLFVRIRRLEESARATRDVFAVTDGVLRHGEATVVLSPLEARLAISLLRTPWRLVGRDELVKAWPETNPSPRTVDRAIARLRARLLTLGLTVTAIRGRGYVVHRGERDDA
jgi:hypothetical protein